MSPFSMPVLAGAGVLSSPALWRAFVEGTAPVEVALTRYLVSLVVCWALLALVVALVGPAPEAEPEPSSEETPAPSPAPASGADTGAVSAASAESVAPRVPART